ncbi:YggS family pyridoxal phosphate-dependent enzyme [Aureibaculum sp. 2210JD6-5]|uniref:YggS family pyridoxal phosphate-dependent enzyme n=1 Tax=Aureibaculum sp. 2210JD6-5 TaxID=3103957 RepID=UPI002AAC556F|nr:YggS family pyridoxal phosphate-dependent enzyme [Aureibaculum sp. 2210JD6-5]MDY7396360.1 YggS family pyridoxal phosphate-dependent enzyme [Aureibaculum sp. 2210JD6-5]
MDISENLKKIKASLPAQVDLVAVSKTKPNSAILEAYNAGQCVFGENRIQEMVDKYEALPKDIEWHMIGHLQRNKVKYMAHFVSLIHGVDSFKTLKEINKQAKKHNRIINCLLQAKIAEEDTKFGLSFSEIEEILASEKLKELKYVSVVGLMGMATFTDNANQIKSEFKRINTLFDKLRENHKGLTTLSIGMSGDYQIAIECGSTMVRIGSAIFGSR